MEQASPKTLKLGEATLDAIILSLNKISNLTDGHPVDCHRRDRIHALSVSALSLLRMECALQDFNQPKERE